MELDESYYSDEIESSFTGSSVYFDGYSSGYEFWEEEVSFSDYDEPEGLSAPEIQSLPRHSGVAFECSICFELATEGTKLQCNHSYHPECLEKWLAKKSTCPYCRDPVYKVSN